MNISTDPAIWTQAICILAVYTYLYKDNPIWRLAETVYLALATTYWFVFYFFTYIQPAIVDKAIGEGEWHYFIAVILGLMIFFRYIPSVAWLARYPMSFWVGYGTGYILSFEPAVWLTQITSTFLALNSLQNILIFIGVLSTLTYFFFTVAKENPVVGGVAEVGKWYIMIALGSAFGNTVLYRWNLFVARANTLLFDWLGVGQA
ncbi:MAG TPA: hypothetical protein DGR79_01635 [Clostridiales bacterium]|nr:hypothetical protein [Clostridiales bacterium]